MKIGNACKAPTTESKKELSLIDSKGFVLCRHCYALLTLQFAVWLLNIPKILSAFLKEI